MRTIHFPNASRSFDEVRQRVCFWGYDKTMEISFYIGTEALQKIRQDVGSGETKPLAAFDATLEKIHDVAMAVYANGSKSKGVDSFILYADDFYRQ
jgi:hypothetical protein